MSVPGNTSFRAARPALGTATILLAGLLLAACEGRHPLSEPEILRNDHERRHPIGAEVQHASLDVPIDDTDLASGAYFDVTRFARQYLRDGRSALEIAVPRRGRAARTAEAVARVVRRAGVSGHRIRMVTRHDGIAAVALRYNRIAAISPDCGRWPENLARRTDQGAYANWGCASQRNLANMVADPTDLVSAKPESSRPSERREATYQAYKGGGEGGKGSSSSAGASSPGSNSSR